MGASGSLTAADFYIINLDRQSVNALAGLEQQLLAREEAESVGVHVI